MDDDNVILYAYLESNSGDDRNEYSKGNAESSNSNNIEVYNNKKSQTTNRRKKRIKPMIFKDFECTCKNNCSKSLPRELREKEFNNFVHLKTFTSQVIYINSLVKEYDKKRSYVAKNSVRIKTRQFSRTYTLSGVKVCKNMFINILQVTPQKINMCLKKMRTGVLTDQRGVAQGGWNRSSLENNKIVEDIINKLPEYATYNRRVKTDPLYKQSGMPIQKIYDEYYLKEFNKLPDRDNQQCLKYGTFKALFYSKLNLKTSTINNVANNNISASSEQDSLVKNRIHQDFQRVDDFESDMTEDFVTEPTEHLECIMLDTDHLPNSNKKIKIKSKIFKDFQCTCQNNCSQSLSREVREREFEKYLNLDSYTAQVLYINSLVQEYNKKRTYKADDTKISKGKQFSRTYTLAGEKVCRDMFVNTLQVSSKKINMALMKMRTGILTDQRGVLQGGWNRSSLENNQMVEDVIKKLPEYDTYTRREKNDPLYKKPGMPIRKIYNEYYLNDFNKLTDSDSKKCLKYGTFKKLFYRKLNDGNDEWKMNLKSSSDNVSNNNNSAIIEQDPLDKVEYTKTFKE